jgi:sodium transport system ATP-binding protein
MIEASSLSKSFREVRALDALSFAARDGSVTALLGRNGAGKSTTLRILYTVMRTDSGNARIDDFDTVSQTRRTRNGSVPWSTRGAFIRVSRPANMWNTMAAFTVPQAANSSRGPTS